MSEHLAIVGLRRHVGGRRVVIVGSAPLDAPIAATAEEVLVPVNGGISSTVGAIAAWMVNSRSAQFEQWGPRRRRLAELMLKQGAKRDVPFALLLAREAEAPPVTLALLTKWGTGVVDHEAVLQKDRRVLEHQASARLDPNVHDAMSAGVTAAAFALLAGAAHVRLVGFSWQPGYAYLPGERIDARGHVAADQRALILLERRYGDALAHALPIPEEVRRRYARGTDMATKKPVARGAAPTPDKAPAAPPVHRPPQLRVQATRDLQFRGRRIRTGDVFTIEPEDLRPRQMTVVTDETPAAAPESLRSPFPFPKAAQIRQQIPGMPRTAAGTVPTVREIAGQAVLAADAGDDDPPTGDPAGSPLE